MDKFKGKRIRVRIPRRGNEGKEDPALPPAFVEGVCNYSGPNRILNVKFMVVIDRSPVFPVEPSDITILD